MAKIIKAAEVLRRRRVKAKQGVEGQRRQRVNTTLAIAIRLEQGFDKVLTEVLVGQEPEVLLTVYAAVLAATVKILGRRMSGDELKLLIEQLSRRLPKQ